MSSVTFSSGVGGNGTTVTDDADSSTGLANGGHRTRFVPALAQVVAVAQNTVTKATEANASAAAALASQTAAAASEAQAAIYAAALTATSSSSLVIGTGSKTFTTQASKQFIAGQWLIIPSAADSTNYMFGQITSYSGTTLTVNVSAIGGSGTFADWIIAISGSQGATGATGVGITSQAVGFIATAGTTPKTLTVDTDLTASDVATKGANTFTDDQNLGDHQIVQAMLVDTGYTYLDNGSPASGFINFDYSAAQHQRIQIVDDQIFVINDWPPSGNLGQLLIELVDGASHIITWPTVNWIKSDGTTTTTFSANGVTLQTSGTDWVFLWTRDAGTTIYGKIVR